MTSLQTYGTDNVDNHHFVSSKQQPVVFESATRSVRQEGSSEAPSPSDAFAPFLGSVWEFHYSDANGGVGELIGAVTFANVTDTDKDYTKLYVTHVNNDNICLSETCWLSYRAFNNSYELGSAAVIIDYDPYKLRGGYNTQLIFRCVTTTCDKVTGTYRIWSWEGTFSNMKPGASSEIIGQRLSPPTSSDQTNTSSKNILPLLGGIALDVNETTIPTETIYLGGISVNGGGYQTQVVQNLADQVDILGNIVVDPRHVGQTADIFVYAEATLPSSEEVSYFALGQGLSIIPLDKDTDFSVLPAFQPDVILEANQVVQIYQGTFFYPGTLKVRFGYQLKDETVVMSAQLIDITIHQ